MRAPRKLGSARSRAPGIPPLRRPAETDQPPQPRPNRQPIREGAGQARPDLQAGQHGSRLLVETALTGSHTPVALRAFRAAAHRSRTSPPPASWPRSPGTCSATNRATLRATVAHPHQAPPARATLRRPGADRRASARRKRPPLRIYPTAPQRAAERAMLEQAEAAYLRLVSDSRSTRDPHSFGARSYRSFVLPVLASDNRE
jgi:hypothetical protein